MISRPILQSAVLMMLRACLYHSALATSPSPAQNVSILVSLRCPTRSKSTVTQVRTVIISSTPLLLAFLFSCSSIVSISSYGSYKPLPSILEVGSGTQDAPASKLSRTKARLHLVRKVKVSQAYQDVAQTRLRLSSYFTLPTACRHWNTHASITWLHLHLPVCPIEKRVEFAFSVREP